MHDDVFNINEKLMYAKLQFDVLQNYMKILYVHNSYLLGHFIDNTNCLNTHWTRKSLCCY